jgi:hypothetical protein
MQRLIDIRFTKLQAYIFNHCYVSGATYFYFLCLCFLFSSLSLPCLSFFYSIIYLAVFLSTSFCSLFSPSSFVYCYFLPFKPSLLSLFLYLFVYFVPYFHPSFFSAPFFPFFFALTSFILFFDFPSSLTVLCFLYLIVYFSLFHFIFPILWCIMDAVARASSNSPLTRTMGGGGDAALGIRQALKLTSIIGPLCRTLWSITLLWLTPLKAVLWNLTHIHLKVQFFAVVRKGVTNDGEGDAAGLTPSLTWLACTARYCTLSANFDVNLHCYERHHTHTHTHTREFTFLRTTFHLHRLYTVVTDTETIRIPGFLKWPWNVWKYSPGIFLRP